MKLLIKSAKIITDKSHPALFRLGVRESLHLISPTGRNYHAYRLKNGKITEPREFKLYASN